MKILIQTIVLFLIACPELKAQSLEDILNRNYEYTVKDNIQYCKTKNNFKLEMDVFTPKIDKSKPLPAIIIIHGGGWGGRDKGHKNFKEMSANYAKRGIVAFNINYRLSKHAPAPAAVQDVHCALRHIKANANKYGINPDMIAATGNSAGCHLALMLAMCDEKFCTNSKEEWSNQNNKLFAVINRFAITDVFERTFGKTPRKSSQNWFANVHNAKNLAKKMSPLSYSKKKNLPAIFSIHGQKDTNTPYTDSVRLHQGLIKSGNKSKLKIIPKGNHGLHNISLEMQKEIEKESFKFLVDLGLF